jgi:hypothetical protein
MKWSHTVMGKPFAYQGDLSRGLVAYPTTREDWSELSGGEVAISPEGIALVRQEIRYAGLIPMGACRDNPTPGSLGEKLYQRGRSPQWLSYIIPLLKEESFCDFFKEGRRYVIRYTGP